MVIRLSLIILHTEMTTPEFVHKSFILNEILYLNFRTLIVDKGIMKWSNCQHMTIFINTMATGLFRSNKAYCLIAIIHRNVDTRC